VKLDLFSLKKNLDIIQVGLRSDLKSLGITIPVLV